MLRSVIEHAWFVDYVWQILRMSWRETVMPASFDVQ